MSEFKIRPARVEEAKTLTALCRRSKAHWGYDADFIRLSARSLAVTADSIATGRILVAERNDGALLGLAAVTPMDQKGTYDLDKLFVEPEAIGSGVGRALLLAIRRLAREEGAERLSILADPNAAAFYERLGAVRVGDAPSDAVPGRMLPLFSMTL